MSLHTSASSGNGVEEEGGEESRSMAEEIVLPIGGSERKNPPHLSRGNDALHCAAGVVRSE